MKLQKGRLRLGVDQRTEVEVDYIQAGASKGIPVVLVGGFASRVKVYEPAVQVLAGREYNVAHFGHARKLQPRHRLTPLETQKIKAETLLAFIDYLYPGQKVIAVAHSEAGVNAMLAAQARPAVFAACVLASVAGLLENDTRFGLMKRSLHKMNRQRQQVFIEPASSKAILLQVREGIRYLTQNPLLAIREAQAVATISVRGAIRNVLAQGVKVAIIHTKDDVLFPLERIEALRPLVTIFKVIPGHHDTYPLAPAGILAVKAVINQLAADA